MPRHKPWRDAAVRAWTAAALTCALLAASAAAGSTADARPPMETIVQDDAVLLHRSDDEVAQSMRQLKELGVDRVRLTAGWSVIAPNPDDTQAPSFDASDPDSYPRANWRNLDRGVRLAQDAGLQVMIDIAFWAPRWATTGDPGEGRARWNVDPALYAQFAKAVVKRYSGSFVPEPDDGSAPPPSQDANWLGALLGGSFQQQASTPPAAQSVTPLPAVHWWTIWNEPNHPAFLQPQYARTSAGLVPNSPHLYRALVEAAYPAIKEIQPDSTVLIGGLASTGDRNPKDTTSGMPPLRFLRELACVDASFRPLRSGPCRNFHGLPGDGFAHHPYSLLNRPDFRDPRNPDSVRIGALDRLTGALDRLVRMGRINRRLDDVYLTEFGYESNPPDPDKPFNLDQQARFINWGEYLAWKNPHIRSWPQFLLRDMGTVSAAEQSAGRRAYGDWQSGLFFNDGAPKPAAKSFRLPLFAQCVSKTPRARAAGRRGKRRSRKRQAVRYVLLWGRVRPGSGVRRVLLDAQKSAGGWRLASTASRVRRGRLARASAESFNTNSSGIFVRYARYRRGARYRVRYTGGGQTETGIATPTSTCGRGGREGPARDDGEY